ncbi:efflux RND transporter periplasmic adaptor subunit [Roseateles sp.]|uniref:efflux RND transporter periplasmic adaptor subunit n=1 Tax=Roseateles sp. TaxID=1971397 RepID=UPI0039E891FC
MSRWTTFPPIAAMAILIGLNPQSALAAGELSTWTVSSGATLPTGAQDGTVEAVRQTVVSAQVPGAVLALLVKVGDHVRAGQLLARLDARAAEQQAGAAAAQVQAARAAQEAATLEFQRQQQLAERRYISQAALERAEAQYKTATAQAQAQQAAALAARTETSYFLIKAPYDAIVSEVSVMPGDMAMPGRPLLTLYDPAALRVAVAVPESGVTRLRAAQAEAVSLEVGGQRLAAARWEVLPAADPATHTVTVRIALPAGSVAAPGSFARAWLPGADAAAARLLIPSKALVQRAELKAVYVVGSDGRALLRQVRVGPVVGEQTEVLSGLTRGERIALDPQAAARRP